MEFRDVSDNPEKMSQEAFDSRALERRVQEATDVTAAGGSPPGGDGPPDGDDPSSRPGTFRYYDMNMDGEVRTSVEQQGGIYDVAEAKVYHRDGTSEVVGTARYSVAGGEAQLHGEQFNARNHGTESALMKEVSEQARAQGAGRLRVWVPDGDSTAASRWQRHGFQPLERDPDARGVYWERRV